MMTARDVPPIASSDIPIIAVDSAMLGYTEQSIVDAFGKR